jgi:tRNA dimethylallyltransferase
MSSSAASDESSVRVICGPTGAGKSSIAMALAESRGALLISADSRQIYRRFDIGTAKPSAAERARVPHRGIDIIDPSERYSAARWAEETRAWLEEAHATNRPVIVVGGTGFYLRALTDPLAEAPVLDPERRAALERVLATTSTDALRRWCTNLDPDRAHLGRTQLIRSVETAMLAGERLSDLHRRHAEESRMPDIRSRAGAIRARYLVVDPGVRLASRIEHRYDAMVAAGWPDEVATLVKDVDASAPAWKASGYGVMREVVAGRMSARDARERVIIETRQYAKRQRTWFRHQLDAAVTTRIDPDDREADTLVNDWWEGRTDP